MRRVLIPGDGGACLGKLLGLGEQLVDLLGEVLLRFEGSLGHLDGIDG